MGGLLRAVPSGLCGAALVGVLACGAAPAAAERAPWRDCGDIAFEPNSDYGAYDVRAKQVRCRTARRVAAGSKETSVVDGPFRYRVRGFRCKGAATDDPLPSVDWVCKRKQARVRFTRS
jgi:hypothetical protein